MSLEDDYNRKKAERFQGPPVKKKLPITFSDNTLPPAEEMPKRPRHPTTLDGVKEPGTGWKVTTANKP